MLRDKLTSSFQEMLSKYPKQYVYDAFAEKAGFIKTPASIEDFILDKYYLGNCLPEGLRKCWVDVLKDIYPNPFFSPYSEVILTGGIGTGKSTAALIGWLKDLEFLLCIKNPQFLFDILEVTEIEMAIFTTSLKLVDSLLWAQVDKILARSPYFQEKIKEGGKFRGAHPDPKKSLFPNNIDIVLGSRTNHTLGQAIFSALVDEMNFGILKGQMKSVFTNLKKRQESRFMLPGGKLLGRIWEVSSKADEEGFLEKYAEQAKSLPDVYVKSMAIWEAKPNVYYHVVGEDGNKYFNVYIGDENTDPRILSKDENLEYIDHERILEVPNEHRRAFELDPIDALRDLAGLASSSSIDFIKKKEIIDAACVLPLIQKKEIISLSLYDDNTWVDDFIYMDVLRNMTNKNTPRCLHLDLSLNGDCASIASSYKSGIKNYRDFNPEKGEWFHYNETIVTVEWALCFQAIPQQQIPFWKIRKFVFTLVDMGFFIAVVSADTYQSADFLQLMNVRGIDTKSTSVDRKTYCYDVFKRGILEDRILLPKHPKLKKELKELKKIRGKWDHPDGGSKDIADGCAGSVFNTLELKGISSQEADARIDAIINNKKPQHSILFNKRRGTFYGGK